MPTCDEDDCEQEATWTCSNCGLLLCGQHFDAADSIDEACPQCGGNMTQDE